MTTLTIDHIFFGSGRGMASPMADARYYWLVDNLNGRGDLYKFSHDHNAQLRSWQWFHPKPSEGRHLCGHLFLPFHSSRRGLRVEVAWSWVGLPLGLDEANAALRKLGDEIGRDPA